MSAAPRPLVALRDRLQALPRPAPVLSGQVVRYDGLHLDTTGFPAQPGALACVQGAQGRPVLAEVVGFEDGRRQAGGQRIPARQFWPGQGCICCPVVRMWPWAKACWAV